ncbi:hypothetical protein [Parachryseolinea silvisoli]|uniref:hypothetical protein n=1 Tax=Parachryseolinea silvisoli TaxID=2873601 RepID=UPI002265E9C7|nr:hypothetical protein [Parachryseolinea silvisoli]MCD9015474.1 hypothetical protein [Parachryseolinea silvisoli]
MNQALFPIMGFKIFAFAGLCLLVSCSGVPATKESIQEYISNSDNGLLASTHIGAMNIEVQFKPTDFLVEEELYGEPLTPSAIDSLRSKYSEYYYFILRLSSENGEALYANSEPGKYSELVQTLSFNMDQFVALTTPLADTIKVADFALDRTHGMGEATTLIFVFERPRNGTGDWIQFNIGDFGLGVGNQNFRFNRTALEEAPTIDFGV